MSDLFSGENRKGEQYAQFVMQGLTYDKLAKIVDENDYEAMHKIDHRWLIRDMTEREREGSRNWTKEGFEAAEKVLSGVKFYKKEDIRVYKIWGWGYDQTNYENLEIVGEMGSYLVGCVNEHNFYKIPKRVEGCGVKDKKGNIKNYYNIDSVRTTSWEKAFTTEEIMNQREFNAAFGH